MSWLLERRLICHDNDAELLPLSPSSGSCQLVLELHHVLSSRQFRLKLLLLSYESQYRWIFHAISGYFASKAVQTQCRVQYWAENMHYTKYKHLPQLTCRITSHFLVLTGLLDVWCTWCLRVFVGTPVSFFNVLTALFDIHRFQHLYGQFHTSLPCLPALWETVKGKLGMCSWTRMGAFLKRCL